MEREIGGYLSLERFEGNEYYPNGLRFCTARGGIAFILRAHNIKRIYMPRFICDTVYKMCTRNDTEILWYDLDENFLPLEHDIDSGEWIYLVNYYGQVGYKKVCKFHETHSKMIVDNVQAFFEPSLADVPTVYSCRKFFGVPDGAYLCVDKTAWNSEYEHLRKAHSYDRFRYLIGRFECGANAFFENYQRMEQELSDSEPLLQMSDSTRNLLKVLPYEKIKRVRTENFKRLDDALGRYNKLHLDSSEGAFVYPFMTDREDMRAQLVAHRIYVPTLWKNVLQENEPSSQAYQLADRIIPLPVDQRYGNDEMKYISYVVKSLF